MFVTESAVGPLTPSSQRRSSVTAAEAVVATDSVTAAHRDSMTDAVAACLPTLPLAGSDSNVADALEVTTAKELSRCWLGGRKGIRLVKI